MLGVDASNSMEQLHSVISLLSHSFSGPEKKKIHLMIDVLVIVVVVLTRHLHVQKKQECCVVEA